VICIQNSCQEKEINVIHFSKKITHILISFLIPENKKYNLILSQVTAGKKPLIILFENLNELRWI